MHESKESENDKIPEFNDVGKVFRFLGEEETENKGEDSYDDSNVPVLSGRYRLLHTIGSGGSGTVYKAFDTRLKRYVACKVFNSLTESGLKQFQTEAETVAKFSHPNIVPLFEVGRHDERYFIAMQYIEGATLDKLTVSLGLAEKLLIFTKVCDAIQYAHDYGIVHRDLKPQNIMVGEDSSVYVLDFGIARRDETVLTKTYYMAGTPQYMAPEQITGKVVDKRADIFSLGSLLYFITTGVGPFEGMSTPDIINKVLEKDPPAPSRFNPELDKDLERITCRCMNKNPRERYQHAADLRDDMEKYLGGINIPIPKGIAGRKRSRRIKTLAVIFIVATLIIMPFIYSLYINNPESYSSNSETDNIESKALAHFENGKALLDITMRTRSEIGREKIGEYYNNALIEFSSALDISPSFAEAYLYRGKTLYRMANFHLASHDFDRAIKYDNSLTEAFYYRILNSYWETSAKVMIYGPKKLDGAFFNRIKNDIERIKALKAHIARLYMTEGIYQLLKLRRDEALQLLIKAYAEDPTIYEAKYLIAHLASFLQEYVATSKTHEEIIEKIKLPTIQNLIELDPNNVNNYILAATAFIRHMKDTGSALQYIRYGREIAPGNTLLLYLTIIRLSEIKDTDGLKKVLVEMDRMEDLYRDRRELSEFLMSRALLKQSLGMPEKSQRDMDRAEELRMEDNADSKRK